jgi:hypothetical protein
MDPARRQEQLAAKDLARRHQIQPSEFALAGYSDSDIVRVQFAGRKKVGS